MIKPHGSDQLNPLYVQDESKRAKLLKEAEGLPSIVVSSGAAANAVMLGGGYFNPLTGYMNAADAMSVAEKMETTSGLFWPTPILNVVKDASAIKDAKRIALLDPNINGNPVLAIQDVKAIEEFSADDMKFMTEKVYRSDDMNHPGVAAFNSVGNFAISGPIQVLNYSYFEIEFPDTFRTAYQIREEMAKLGWEKVVAFQTRNPMHLAHEELCRMAYNAEKADGILIHMLLGKLKKGDIPADVRCSYKENGRVIF
jgi:sulfate adenylyltransferase